MSIVMFVRTVTIYGMSSNEIKLTFAPHTTAGVVT